jgi:hypothetical protein
VALLFRDLLKRRALGSQALGDSGAEPFTAAILPQRAHEASFFYICGEVTLHIRPSDFPTKAYGGSDSGPQQ